MCYRLIATVILKSGEVQTDTRVFLREEDALNIACILLDGLDRSVIKHADCTVEEVEQA